MNRNLIYALAAFAAVMVVAWPRKANAASVEFVMNPQNWRTLPGYIAAQGQELML